MPKKDFAKELEYLNTDQNLQITKFWVVTFELLFEQLYDERPYRKKDSMIPQICERNQSSAKNIGVSILKKTFR